MEAPRAQVAGSNVFAVALQLRAFRTFEAVSSRPRWRRMSPVVLLVSTATRWVGAERIPEGLAKAGFSPMVLAPQDSLSRSPTLPGVPTVAESGYPGFEVRSWYGVLAPAGTPADVARWAKVVRDGRLRLE